MLLHDVQMSTAIATWLATALLHMENPEKDFFQTKDIVKKIHDENLVQTSSNTIMAHITVHCVANTKPWPNLHRKLYRISPGRYRLYKDGDEYHPARENGKSAPASDEIPSKYHKAIDWYNAVYNIGTKIKKVKPVSLPVTMIAKNGSIKIPDSILEKLNLNQDDYLAFLENTNGEIVLKKARIEVE